MPIAAQDGKPVLTGKRCNSQVIRRNRLPGFSQLEADRRVMMCGLLVDVEHPAVLNQAIQPAAMPRLSDPIAVFTDHNNRKSQFACAARISMTAGCSSAVADNAFVSRINPLSPIPTFLDQPRQRLP